MKVVCVTASGDGLPESFLDMRINITRESEFPLTVGREYLVYAVTTYLCHTWFYVFDENRLAYPVWYLAEIFRVSDRFIPRWWTVNYFGAASGSRQEGRLIVSFDEWASDPTFYERLVDGDADAQAVLKRHRSAMESP